MKGVVHSLRMNQSQLPYIAEPLAASLVESVLTKLGISHTPEPTLDSLKTVYRAWCQLVPFDNARKLIALRGGAPGPFPGDSAEDFFRAWMAHGSGGTCWAANGALCAFLQNLGFDASPGIATMMAAPNLPPNHGTVSVLIDAQRYLVDASILHVDPLPITEGAATQIDHPAWGIRCTPQESRWVIAWRPQLRPEGLNCQINRLDATRADFRQFYEATRAWGPFNYQLAVRTNRGDSVLGIVFGQRVDFDPTGAVSQSPLTYEQRTQQLIDTFGYSEEIAHQIPADIPTPPPPGSKTAMFQ